MKKVFYKSYFFSSIYSVYVILLCGFEFTTSIFIAFTPNRKKRNFFGILCMIWCNVSALSILADNTPLSIVPLKSIQESRHRKFKRVSSSLRYTMLSTYFCFYFYFRFSGCCCSCLNAFELYIQIIYCFGKILVFLLQLIFRQFQP